MNEGLLINLAVTPVPLQMQSWTELHMTVTVSISQALILSMTSQCERYMA